MWFMAVELDAATNDTYSFFNNLITIPPCAIIHIKYKVENGSNIALESTQSDLI